jgi:hypothetical protein
VFWWVELGGKDQNDGTFPMVIFSRVIFLAHDFFDCATLGKLHGRSFQWRTSLLLHHFLSNGKLKE